MPKGKGALQANRITTAMTAGQGVVEVELDQLQPTPNQPRRYFSEEAHLTLVQSIKEHGIIQPLVVRKTEQNQYQIIAGERRYRAATEVGLKSVPIIIKEITEKEAKEIALVDNLQRDDLNPLDEVDAILEILALKLDVTVKEITLLLYQMANEDKGNINRNVTVNQTGELVEQTFAQLGRHTRQSFVRNRLPLLKLPDDVLEPLRAGKLPYTKAVEVAKVKDKKARAKLLNQALLGAGVKELRQARQGLVKQSSKSVDGGIGELLELAKSTKSNLTAKRLSALEGQKLKQAKELLNKLQELLGE